MKWIGIELLKQDGMTIKDLADILEPQGISYRTIYAFFKRKGGSLELGAKLAKGMGRTLNDVYVEDNYILPANSKQIPSKEPSLISTEDKIIKALIKCIANVNDGTALSKATYLLGMSGYTEEAEICNERAKQLKTNNNSDKTEV